jgi:ligand-binding sensor domain-containing protein
MTRITFTLLTLCFACQCGLAQTPATWRYLIPHDQVTGILPDGQSVWLTTTDGLIRYDQPTAALTYFDQEHDLPGAGNIHGMARLNGGIVIVTYDFGMLYVEGNEWSQFTPDNSPLPNLSLNAVLPAADGGVWLAPKDHPALLHFDGSNWSSLALPDSNWSAFDYPRSMHYDQAGGLWVGTQSRLLRYQPDQDTWTDLTDSMATGGCWAFQLDYVYQDQQERLWVNASTAVFLLDEGEWRTLSFNLTISDIFEDAQGEVWVMGKDIHNQRLFHLVNDSLVEASQPTGPLAQAGVSVIEPDGAGGYWVGSNLGKWGAVAAGAVPDLMPLSDVPVGLRRAADVIETTEDMWVLGPFALYQYHLADQRWTTHDLPETAYNRILATPDGLVILQRGTNRLPMRLADGQWTPLPLTATLPDATYIDAALAPDSSLWVLTEQVLYHQTASGWDAFGWDGSGLPRYPYRGMTIDAQGQVWVANQQAKVLSRYDGSGFTNFTNPEPSIYQYVHVNLVADAQGDVWLRHGQTRQRWQAGSIQSVPSSRSYLSVCAIDSAMWWLGYDSIRVENSQGEVTWAMAQRQAPLSADLVGTVHQDHLGNLWMVPGYQGTGYLSVYNPDGVVFAAAEDTSANDTSVTHLTSPTAQGFHVWQQGDQWRLRTDLPVGTPLHWELLTVQGQRLWVEETTADGQTQLLPSQHLAPGIYLLRLETPDQQQAVKVWLR